MRAMKHARVLQRFADHVVVADGAMGSELLARLPAGAHLDLAAMEHPREVLDIHLAYLEAGAELLETATFAASRPRLERLHDGDLVDAVNAAAVKLAREAREIAGVDCLIAGSIGPLAGVIDMDEPEGRSAIAVAHAEQAAILAGRGADLLILETFFRLDELELAIGAVRDVTDLPFVAPAHLPRRAAAAAVRGARRAGPRALRASACSRPESTARPDRSAPSRCSSAREAPGPLAAMPNAGTLVRRERPHPIAAGDPELPGSVRPPRRRLGVVLVGGCCGTGPDHITRHGRGGPRPAPGTATSAPRSPSGRRPAAARSRAHSESHLAAKLARGEFVRIVQLDPPKGTNADRILDACRAIAAAGTVDAVDINSNPLARLRMDSLWLAAEIQRTVGITTIPHITPRDASLMGLQAQLLGAWRAGIRNLLAISGDPSQLGDYPGVHDVYHVDIFELVRSVSRMAEGFDCAGNPIGEPPSFFIGVAVNPCADDLDAEIDRLRRKVEDGAHFVMSQVFFEWEPWLRLLDRCGGALPLPALVAVWPLSSLRLALRLHHEVPGILVPDDLLADLEQAGAEAARVGMERARRLLHEAPEHAAGAYVIAPFRNPEEVLHLLAETA